ncbi:GNAT family N-acetyltransferase [Nesterenkonia sp. K-15-9-6]|uniref:GNAT family N-acetyltransferase n=1 Tax=Nesterenkonia sp. K-15-9-6 TaxID=3093918 RepID=UPI0026877498
MVAPAPLEGPTVREIRATDLPAFLAARPDAASMGPYLLRQQTSGIGTGLVAFCGEELSGSLELCWTWPAEVRNVHVVETWRGQGIGTALMNAAEQAVLARAAQGESADDGEPADDEEALSLQLRVSADNAGGRRLYERLGYRPTGVRTTTTFSSVDDGGAPGTATETEELLVKRLEP